MNENKLMQQVGTMFGVLMTFFYIGVGLYLIFFADRFNVDKFLRILLGSTFIFYGIYRAYRTYVKVVEVFFTDDNNKKEDS
jgi:amino acid permease